MKDDSFVERVAKTIAETMATATKAFGIYLNRVMRPRI